MERIRTPGETVPCNHKARDGVDAANRVGIGGTVRSRRGITLGHSGSNALGSHSRILS